MTETVIYLRCFLSVEQVRESRFFAPVSSSPAHQTVETGLHHSYTALDIRTVFQGRNSIVIHSYSFIHVLMLNVQRVRFYYKCINKLISCRLNGQRKM